MVRISQVLFLFFYRLAKFNYGKEGGAYASVIIVSILMSMNVISLLTLLLRRFHSEFTVNLVDISIVFLFCLFVYYFHFIYNLKYQKFIRDTEDKGGFLFNYSLPALAFFVLSLGFLIFTFFY